ncbi:hypothetical protein CHU_2128 [Cytophaga hutchinsonii ATCC 33406]|uniref:Uncharacterized protein n=1 Tax=Cytophaga hutchinsonii (strain ATCC 33406 / DSM 1761 / CIP 103989 / NBRC 15051 / NCIMB 9469 / D465) TaxID=269798 RepID=A0A6N4SSK7_CYTH3|nr:hypothetical protein CHU_2128 [Cytophaga hutchinsonii ATCC 33406]
MIFHAIYTFDSLNKKTSDKSQNDCKNVGIQYLKPYLYSTISFEYYAGSKYGF